MDIFDQKVWIENSVKRHKSKKGKSLKIALKKDAEDVKRLDKVIKWCEKKSIDVIFYNNTCNKYEISDRTIFINKKMLPGRQLHILLHECGHHLIGSKDHTERYGWGYSQTNHHIKKTLRHSSDLIDEEFEAWWRGWKLGQRLKLGIDKLLFDKTKSLALKTYFVWAAHKK